MCVRVVVITRRVSAPVRRVHIFCLLQTCWSYVWCIYIYTYIILTGDRHPDHNFTNIHTHTAQAIIQNISFQSHTTSFEIFYRANDTACKRCSLIYVAKDQHVQLQANLFQSLLYCIPNTYNKTVVSSKYIFKNYVLQYIWTHIISSGANDFYHGPCRSGRIKQSHLYSNSRFLAVIGPLDSSTSPKSLQFSMNCFGIVFLVCLVILASAQITNIDADIFQFLCSIRAIPSSIRFLETFHRSSRHISTLSILTTHWYCISLKICLLTKRKRFTPLPNFWKQFIF